MRTALVGSMILGLDGVRAKAREVLRAGADVIKIATRPGRRWSATRSGASRC